MTEPSFELPPPQPSTKRPILGWIAFFLVVGLLTAQQFAGYMDRAGDSEKPDIASLDAKLKTIVKSASLETAILSLANPSNSKGLKERAPIKDATKRDLDELASELDANRKTDGAFELLYTITRFESQREIDGAGLDHLAKETGPRRRAAAKIYTAKSLSGEEAANLSKPFTGEFFADKLVQIHIKEKAGDFDYRWIALKKGATGMAIAATALFFAGTAGCMIFLAYIAARALGKWKPLGHPSGTLTYAQADGNAMRTSLMLVGLFGGQVVVLLLLGSVGMARELKALLSFGLSLAFAVYLVRSPVHGHRLTFAQIGITKNELLKNVLWGIGAALANLPLVLIAAIAGSAIFSWLPPAHHPIQDELTGASPIATMFLFIAAAVFAPIFEEMAFRGTLLPALARVFGGPFFGIVLCGLFFAMIHPTGVPAWPALATIGIVAAHLTYQRKSLVPAIVMHAVHNGGILAFSLLALS